MVTDSSYLSHVEVIVTVSKGISNKGQNIGTQQGKVMAHLQIQGKILGLGIGEKY